MKKSKRSGKTSEKIEERAPAIRPNLEDEMDLDFDLFEVTPETNPAKFLNTFKNWGDYCVLSAEEYGRLRGFV